MFSVEGTFDDAGDAAVRREWEMLAGAGLPSLATHTSASNRPHVTFVVRSARPDPAALEPVAAALPIELVLAPPSTFASGDRFILVREVVLGPALATLHRALDAASGPSDLPGALTDPDRWTPHITLARRMDAEQVERARAVVPERLPPLRLERLRIWDSVAKSLAELGPAPGPR